MAENRNTITYQKKLYKNPYSTVCLKKTEKSTWNVQVTPWLNFFARLPLNPWTSVSESTISHRATNTLTIFVNLSS